MKKLAELLGFPSPPTEEEVLAVIDGEKWRSDQYILELINKNRRAAGQLDLDGKWIGSLSTKTRLQLVILLNELADSGIITKIGFAELTTKDMLATDDPRLSSAVASHKARRGRPGAAYRKSRGGHRVQVEQTEAAPALGELVPA